MKKDKKNLSESLKDLDEIVDWFEERDEVDVEGGLKKVKIGVKLVSEIKKQLKDVENEFEEAKKELGDGNL
ncbi:MAG: exodeoxyribonuclease VII small subunit [Candidatus Moranbacteria bacterium]|nr:exodeoxyribonuclease VII small subunit [Candidatus Moranbacteria bacterium]